MLNNFDKAIFAVGILMLFTPAKMVGVFIIGFMCALYLSEKFKGEVE